MITYTPGLLDEAVADYTFALLLGVARRSAISVHPAGGHNNGAMTFSKTMASSAAAGSAPPLQRATGFNMRLLADPFPNERLRWAWNSSPGNVAPAKRLRLAACGRDPETESQCASTAPHEAEQLPDQRRPRRVVSEVIWPCLNARHCGAARDIPCRTVAVDTPSTPPKTC